MSELIVNGKHYPLWSQFIERKNEWIGGELIDHDMGMTSKTVITDIELEPNGDDSAFFRIKGKDFDCGFDVHHGGISGNQELSSEWLGFYGYSNSFKIKKATT